MAKESQFMVGMADTVFCAAMTDVPVVVKKVCITQTMLSIPGTMICANVKIFLSTQIIFPVNEKMVSGLGTTIFVSQTKDSVTKTMVPETNTIVEGTKTIVEADH